MFRHPPRPRLIWVTRGNDRIALPLTLSRPALKAAMPLLRAKGYRSIYPRKAGWTTNETNVLIILLAMLIFIIADINAILP